ncbi:MAG TPA: hypothetical protein VEH50_04190 [Methylomirabilota bacterium]|nr:hypothetical protein [Methylomirabilota bacterium]
MELEPGHSGICYSSELLDDIFQYKFIKEEELLFQANLNLLFFDSLTLGAASILTHPLLSSLVEKDPDIIQYLFVSNAILPIFLEGIESFEGVVDEMTGHGVRRWIKDEKLRRFAKRLDDAGVKPALFDRQTDLRSRQFQKLYQLVQRIESGPPKKKLLGKALPRPGDLGWFLRWLDNNRSCEISISQIHRFLDGAQNLDDSQKSTARMMALATHAEVMREGQASAVSSFGGFNPYFALLEDTGEEQPSDRIETKPATPERETLLDDCSLPFLQIASLPLADVAWLRGQPTFAKARRKLGEARYAPLKIDKKELRDCLGECCSIVENYSMTAQGERQRVRWRTAKAKRTTRTRLLLDVAGGAAGTILLVMHEPGAAVLLCIFTAARQVIQTLTSSSRPPLADFDRGPERPGLKQGRRNYNAIKGGIMPDKKQR